VTISFVNISSQTLAYVQLISHTIKHTGSVRCCGSRDCVVSRYPGMSQRKEESQMKNNFGDQAEGFSSIGAVGSHTYMGTSRYMWEYLKELEPGSCTQSHISI
jgi:hypothetical protein